jgi:hypothetical protein
MLLLLSHLSKQLRQQKESETMNRPYMPQKPTPGNAPKTPNYRKKARQQLRKAGKLEGLNPQQRKRRVTSKAKRMRAKDMTVAGSNPMNKVMFSKGGMATAFETCAGCQSRGNCLAAGKCLGKSK